MHFGTLVKNYVRQHSLLMTAADVAASMNRPESEVLNLFELADWPGSEIKLFSSHFDYDFGKFVGPYENDEPGEANSEFSLYIKYPKGNKQILMAFLDEIKPIAASNGVELT